MLREIGSYLFNWFLGWGGIGGVASAALWLAWYFTPPLLGSKTPLLHAAVTVTAITLAGTYLSGHYYNIGYQVAINQVAANTKEAKDEILKAGQSVDDCNNRGGNWDTVSGMCDR